jgi:hypothetical protein
MSKGSGATIRNYFVRFLTRNSALASKVGSCHLGFATAFVRANHLTGLVEEFDRCAVLFEDYLNEVSVNEVLRDGMKKARVEMQRLWINFARMNSKTDPRTANQSRSRR